MAGRYSRRLICLVVGMCGLPGAAIPKPLAVVPSVVGLSRFKHDTFVMDDGAPESINGIAQTRDGYLWLAADDGLFRFDGTAFERISSAQAISLLVASDGQLWVGLGKSGGVAVYRDGELVDTHMPDPPKQMLSLAEAPKGTIWAQWGSQTKRLWRWRKDAWSLIDREVGLPPGYLMKPLGRRDGSLWIPILTLGQLKGGLARYTPRLSSFEITSGNLSYPALAEDSEGQIWIADRHGTWKVNGRHPSALVPPKLYPAISDTVLPDMSFDRWGGIWQATKGGGVERIAGASQPSKNLGEQVEAFLDRDGLSSNRANISFIDRQGSVWIGTERGLDRFRLLNITPVKKISVKPGSGAMISSSSDGTISLLTAQGAYLMQSDGAAQRITVGLTGLSAVCSGRQGTVWVAGDHAMVAVRAGHQVAKLALPAGGVLNCAIDRGDQPWVLSTNYQVWRRNSSGWVSVTHAHEMLAGTGIAANGLGQVAFWTDNGDLRIVGPTAVQNVPLRNSALGPIKSIDPTATGFLISFENGLMRIGPGGRRIIRREQVPWAGGNMTVLQTAAGLTWLYASNRLVVLPSHELDQVFMDQSAPTHARVFAARDGLGPGQRIGFPGTQAAATPDGRLWLLTGAGVMTLDPNSLTAASGPPAVSIRSLAFGKKLVLDPRDPVLPKGTSSVRIVYAAAELAFPDAVKFRFKLDGVDPDWVEPGSRRATTYTNLSPGSYHFEVRAIGIDGRLGSRGAELNFRIVPTFVQSLPFKILCGLVALGFATLLYRVRLNFVAADIRTRSAERHGERERIARDLHDTLLQSIQGLMLHVQVAADALPEEAPARERLETALHQVDEVVLEGRARVHQLRAPLADTDLATLLDRSAQAYLSPSGIVFTLAVSGDVRPLDNLVLDEINLIAKETFFNVLRHSGSKRVEVEIAYLRERLQVRLLDDGVGISPQTIQHHDKDGHFGMIGIRERAARMRGLVEIKNGSVGGLETTLTVPARVAYRAVRGGKSWWRRLAGPDRL